MTRRSMRLPVLGFIASRGLLVALTAAAINILASKGDIALYSGWSDAIVDGAAPYSEIPIEYPPAVLPFLLGARVLAWGIHYRTAFVAVMALVDVVGFAGLLLIGRRTGVSTGAWIWVLGVFLLGPIVYLRLDLIPAVATIWAIERAAAGGTGTSGGLFAFGVAAKLYPAVLMPAALLQSPRRARFVIGAALVTALAIAPFVFSLGDLWNSVFGYHGGRGIQLESSWGAALMIAARRGYEASLEFSFGALHVRSAISPVLETLSNVLSATVVVVGTWLVARRTARGDAGNLAVGLYGILALVMFTGSVLSPQFVVWLIALGAAGLCFRIPSARTPLLLIVPIAALTQIEFPFNFGDLKEGEPGALLWLIARNLLLLGAGVTALMALRATAQERPLTEA
ncbi:MAG: hypothetical protein ACRDI3_01295 [Actinomycetota bacterium]